MESEVKKNSIKEEFSKIRNVINNKLREKKSISEGSILYYGEDNVFGICTSNKKFVTLANSFKNAKVIEEDICSAVEYFIACIDKDVFQDKKLYRLVKKSIGEKNIFFLKYKNSYNFINNKINESKGTKNKAETFEEIKKVLEKEYGINKWRSSFTSLTVKELEDKIEERENEREKIKNNYKKLLDENLENQRHILKKMQKMECKEEKKKLFNLKKQVKQLEKEFNEKEKELLLEITNIKKELEEAKKKEMQDSKVEVNELEQNMKNLLINLEHSNNLDLEEALAKIRDFQDLKKEINDEDIKYKKEIIFFINALGKIEQDYTTNKEVIKGWDLTLSEFKKLGSDFFHLLSIYENDPKLKKFVNKIGRKVKEEDFKKEKFEKLNKLGNEEILGIELNNDIMRLLPSELVYLSDPATEDLFYLKYLEKKLLCYSLIGNEREEKEKKVSTEEKGAIIALLDTSGSMNGAPIDNSRAILLNTFKIAKKDKRDMKVMLFGSYNQSKEYTVDYNYDINKFIHFISGGYSGGTDYETPLNKAIDIATRDEKYKFADIFMLTDGACTISPTLANRIRNAKNKLDLKIYTVIFGNYGYNDIDNFSDNIFRI